MPNKVVKIGERLVGEGQPCYLIAEVGTTCLGDMDNALQLIEAAAEAGVDAVKFQMPDPEQLSDASVEYAFSAGGKKYLANMKEMFTRMSFTNKEWKELYNACSKYDLEFFATVDHLSGVERLDALGVRVHKMGAWDINYRPLVEKIAATGKPMFMDLGPATAEEMRDFTRWFEDAGGTALLYMHDFHTTVDNQKNMRAIQYLSDTQKWPSGFSSPSRDNDLDIVALSLGASHIEKRLILDRNLLAYHADESLEPEEIKDWVKNIRRVESALGNQSISPSDTDREMCNEHYRSVCTIKPIKAGEAFHPTNLDSKRPGTGISPAHLPDIWGKVAVRDLDVDVLICDEDIK